MAGIVLRIVDIHQLKKTDERLDVRHAIIGAILIFYALMLSPCFIEPSDIVVSTAYIAASSAAGIPVFVIILWAISGYIALVIGSILLGSSIFRHLPAIAAGTRNPVVLLLLIVFIASVICMWFAYVS